MISYLLLSYISIHLSLSATIPAKVIIDGSRTIHQYGNMKIEVLEQLGMDEEKLNIAENAITTYFTIDKVNSGESANQISRVMKRRYGGHWTVVIIEDPYIMYTTIPKRSTSFALFDVNGAGLFIGREGFPSIPITWKNIG